ncbi:urea amidolyase [Opitutaceae bacterium TAV5]|nr:urea amidolyase [Opitutaceae bacterium TAV5]
MSIEPLGDSALLVMPGDRADEPTLAKVLALAKALRANLLPGVHDIVTAVTSVAVLFRPDRIAITGNLTPMEVVRAWVTPLAKKAASAKSLPAGREVLVPVCYGDDAGPDLGAVARHAGLSPDEVVALHTEARYRVAAVGFAPGFPYLLGLPAKLHVPRRSSPRARVPAGSVGIGGGQTGIYPAATPGGWQIIGKTPLTLFDPAADRPTLLEPGDRVRFAAIPESEALAMATPPPETRAGGGRASGRSRSSGSEQEAPAGVIEVLRPGSLTSVQDPGRPGYSSIGVTPGGAMDAISARIANILAGNPEDAPVLELGMSGPRLHFSQEAVVALAGARIAGVATARPWRVQAGEVLELGRFTAGNFAYLAVAGGLQVPVILGGAGTHLGAGFGGWQGRTLRTGDEIPWCAPPGGLPAHGTWSTAEQVPVTKAADATRDSPVVIRCVRGVQADWFDERARRAFVTGTFAITRKTDRMGMRLDGPTLTLREPREMISQPVVTGSVQVPPNGKPIVLLADRQTIGGYPQIAHVISADLPRLVQTRPGGAVQFVEVSVTEAQRAWLDQTGRLTRLRMAVSWKRGGR